MATARQWLEELGLIRPSSRPGSSSRTPSPIPAAGNDKTLGILSFETAKTMSRLLSLHASLTDAELRYLRSSVFRSEGVVNLNSSDEGLLINLACTEKLEDLDRAAFSVARLGKKCLSPELRIFDKIYDDIKLGAIDFSKSMIPIKKLERRIAKMEKFVTRTSALYSGLEILSELEFSERKLKVWRNYSGPITAQKPNSSLFDEKVVWQRRHIKHMRSVSLWNQPFDLTIEILTQMVCNVFARLCIVFGPYVPDLPKVVLEKNMVIVVSQKIQPQRPVPIHASGPLERLFTKGGIQGKLSLSKHRRFGSDKFRKREKTGTEFPIQEIVFGFNVGGQERCRKKRRIMEEASSMTIGFAALSMHYAHIIIMAEKMLNYIDSADGDVREELYQKLPSSMRRSLKAKMKSFCVDHVICDQPLVDRWKEKVTRIMGWLAPMARDTIQWQAERNFERQQFELRPTVLLLQTLYFSNREKTEEAIVEVLVGMSYILHSKDQQPISSIRDTGKGSLRMIKGA